VANSATEKTPSASLKRHAFRWHIQSTRWRFSTTALQASAIQRGWKGESCGTNRATGENAIWLMNGTTLLGGAVIATITDPKLDDCRIGDFNADGKSDILWRNTATGQNMIYLMNGVRSRAATAVATVADPQLEIAGVGDLR